MPECPLNVLEYVIYDSLLCNCSQNTGDTNDEHEIHFGYNSTHPNIDKKANKLMQMKCGKTKIRKM